MISFTVCHVVGAVFLGIGLPIAISFSYIFDALVHMELELGPNSIIFAEWNDTPIPIYMDFYMWNWTNAEEFDQNRTIIPEFKEVGPFVFKVETKRANVQWNDNNTVTYAPERTYFFEPDMSLDINTPITNLSPVPSVLSYYGRLWKSPFFLAIINRELNLREKLYQTESAGNWLFYGINDTFYDLIVPMKEVADLPLPFDKFAWFFGRNHSTTAEGVLTIDTGGQDLSNLGSVVLWKGLNTTEAFKGHCGEIGGSTGELLPPMKDKPEFLSVFSPDICSQMSLDWFSDTEVYGVSGWEFTGTKRALDDGSLYPENSCFCNDECVPAGLRNISACKFGSPAFVSFPHLYLVDESISSRVKGMEPNQSLHEFSLKMEPTLGIPLYVRAQLQINLRINSFPAYDLYKDLPELYIPMLWFRERAEITPELANMLNWVLLVPTIGPAVFYSLTLIGVLLLSSTFIAKLWVPKKTYNMKSY